MSLNQPIEDTAGARSPDAAAALAMANARIAMLIAERHALQQELENRVRNSLAVVRSIARRSVADAETVEDYQSLLDGRLASFLRVQAATLANPAAGVDLELLLSDALLALGIRADGPVSIGGPDLRLDVRAAEVMGLIFHELATAAALGGACARPTGRLTIGWSADPLNLTIGWSERGGRSSCLPDGGFAADMLHNVLPYEFAGSSEIRHFDMGVDYRFQLSRKLAMLPIDGHGRG